MKRGLLALAVYFSAIFFPWPLTVVLTLISSLFEPILPLAVGLFLDTLYYAQQSGMPPYFTLFGALATVVAFLVRRRLNTSIITG